MRSLSPLSLQRGLALVEIAITLPFLLFVMLVAAEFSNAFVTHTTLTKAARDAARYAAEEAIDGTLQVNLDAKREVPTDKKKKEYTTIREDTKRLLVYGKREVSPSDTPLVPGLSTDDVTVDEVPKGSNNIEVSVKYVDYSGILGSVLPTFGYGPDFSLVFDMHATVTMRAL